MKTKVRLPWLLLNLVNETEKTPKRYLPIYARRYKDAGAKIYLAQENSGPPVQKDIAIEIMGDNLDTLVKTADRLKNYIAKQNIAGIENLIADVQNDKPEIVFDIDRERANREGISTKTINDNLQAAVFGIPAANLPEYKRG